MSNLYKVKKFGYWSESKLFNFFLGNIISILIVNWFFQGVRGMQLREISFRILLEIVLFTLCYLFFFSGLTWSLAIFYPLFVSHTINWIFNTHLWVCIRYMKIYKRDPDALRSFLKKASNKLNSKAWVDEAVCIGSIGDKGDVSSWRSDIDLRLFFKPGCINFIRMNCYLIYLRTWALFTVIPLDLYAYDDIEYLARFKSDEGIKVIKDVNNRIKRRFADRVMG